MSRKSSKKEKQSGVIPYRVSNGKAEVLLISSRTSKKWGIPKGGIAKAMTAADSAVKEAWEEAGVVGGVNSSLLGSYQYRKQGKIYHVEVFLLQVEAEYSDWQEANTRERQWLDVPSAAALVKPVALKRLLKTCLEPIKSELSCD